VFPPTYGVDSRAEHNYAFEKRRIDGEDVPCVLLDSVASQANRRELALLQAVRDKEASVPLVTVDFRDTAVPELDRISSLEAPHRIFDALLRDSTLDGVLFRLSDVGRAITDATHRNAAAIFRWSPTTLLFGGWDSTGPKGGKGAKYERAITAEITAINSEFGVKTSSRIDPAGIELKAGPVYEAIDGSWTLNETEAVKDAKGKPVAVSSGGEGAAGRPSQVNHGNIVPSIDSKAGGITADRFEAITVLSFPALRRLRFPTDSEGRPLEGDRRAKAEATAHTAIAALGLASTVLALEDGFDLRSRCVLAPKGPIDFELLSRDGEATEFVLSRGDALELLTAGVETARAAGLAWQDEEILLRPTDRLIELVRRSHELAATGKGDSEVD
jgi:CRISPR-associated protein Csb1